MIVVLQRVTGASVSVGGETVARIGHGVCLLCCAVKRDEEEQATWLADKIAGLRVFPDNQDRTNLDLAAVGGEVLLVPQFTLAADWRRGRRPAFTRAASRKHAQALLDVFEARLAARGLTVRRGRFGARMTVDLANEGPFTLILDSAAPGGPS